jgi:hypothetical protein
MAAARRSHIVYRFYRKYFPTYVKIGKQPCCRARGVIYKNMDYRRLDPFTQERLQMNFPPLDRRTMLTLAAGGTGYADKEG